MFAYYLMDRDNCVSSIDASQVEQTRLVMRSSGNIVSSVLNKLKSENNIHPVGVSQVSNIFSVWITATLEIIKNETQTNAIAKGM